MAFNFGLGGASSNTAAPNTGISLTAGKPAASAAATGFSFGTTPAAPAATTTFGLATTTPAASSTGLTLNFGAPSAVAPATGGGFGTATAPASGGFSLAKPAATTTAAAGAPLQFGGFGGAAPATTSTTATTAAAAAPPAFGGFGVATTAAAATTTAAGGFSFGGTTAPTAATTNTAFGGFGLATATTATVASAASGLGGTTATTTTAVIGLGGSMTTSSLGGLGGQAVPTSQVSTDQKSENKNTKDGLIPAELAATVEELKKHVKEEKSVCSDISHISDKQYKKVQEETDALSQLVSTLATGIHKNRQVLEKLKLSSAQELLNVEIAQRTKEIPSSMQYENVAPMEYFVRLVSQFENDMAVYRKQIEQTQQHLQSMGSGSGVSSGDIAQAVQRLHAVFTELAAKYQVIHHTLAKCKEQYVTIHRRVHGSSVPAFEKRKALALKVEPALPTLNGPSPFSAPTDPLIQARAALPHNKTQHTINAGIGPPTLGLNMSATPAGAFGSFSANQGFGGTSGGFGANTTGFGASTTGFGSNTSGFGGNTTFGGNTSGFGANTTGFGANTSGFGANTTTGFGTSGVSGFGANTTGFGGNTSGFGGNTSGFGAGGSIFGGGAVASPPPAFGATSFTSPTPGSKRNKT